VLQTPKGSRLHIGFFGRRNVGKSSLLNALTGQQVAIVSDVAGTTTDPVEKAMELKPLGPVLFVDTAGVDDEGDLGRLRVARTRKALAGVDVAVIVSDEWRGFERDLADLCRSRGQPVVLAANKADLRPDRGLEEAAAAAGLAAVVRVSAATGEGVGDLREAIARAAQGGALEEPALVGDLLNPGDLAILVVPIDLEAPKGRLILPQVQTLRDILDHDACAMVVKERELADALARLTRPPALVITDSQEFLKVSADVPPEVPLTSFSILLARFKGDLAAFARGALAIETLKPGDSVLIAESCTHHPIGEDIGRVKIPRWLEQVVGGKLAVRHTAGHDFPEDLETFKLVIQCGSCMHTRRQVLERVAAAQARGVPITNYGLAIAFCLGIFERALGPFPYALDLVRRARHAREVQAPRGFA
jgi:[FeFe] hydrogenase H-cluster maturation GTPase HydF